MTLPNERTRAVQYARDFLRRLASAYGKDAIKKIPRDVRQEAIRILRHFPGDCDLYEAAKKAPSTFDKPGKE